MDKSELIYTEYDSRVNHATERLMHRLTATDTLMVRYTRTIFPSHAPKSKDEIKKNKGKKRGSYNKKK